MARRTVRFLILAAIVAFPARGQFRDADAWELILPASSIHEMLEWNGLLVGADDGGGLFLLDPADDRVTRLTSRDGLASNQVTSMVVSGDGSLWVGTDNAGLTRVFPDGRTQLIIGIADLGVQALDADGSLVVYGTRAGAGPVIDDIPGLPWTEDDGLVSDDVRAIDIEGNFIWMGTDAGVSRFDRGANMFETLNDGLVGSAALRVNDLLVDAAGARVATDDGAYRFDEGSGGWVPLAAGLDVAVAELGFEGSDLLAVDANERVHRLAPAATDWAAVPLVYSNRGADSVLEFAGELWVGGTARTPGAEIGDPQAILWATGRDEMFVQRGLFGERARGIALDGAGGFWIGVFPPGGGITRAHDSGALDVYNLVDRSDSGVGFCGDNPKLALLQTSTGDLWASSFTNCIDRMRAAPSGDPADAEYLHFDDASLLQSSRVTSIVEDPLGRIWFCSDGATEDAVLDQGIDLLLDPANPESPGSWQKITSTNSQLAGNKVRDVAFGPGGSIWISITEIGLQLFQPAGLDTGSLVAGLNDPQRWITIDAAQIGRGLKMTNVRSLAIHPDGSLWFATLGEGVVRYADSGASVNVYRVDALGGGMLSNEIRDLDIDAAGVVWTVSDAGLNRIEGSGFDADIQAWTDAASFQLRDLGTRGFSPESISPLFGSDLQAIRFDAASGDLFLVGNGGAARVDRARLRSVGGDDGGGTLRLYPNPARAGDGRAFADGFAGIATVRVYTLQGQLITERAGYEGGDGDFWDLRDLNGEFVASGLYIVQVESAAGTQQGILAIER